MSRVLGKQRLHPAGLLVAFHDVDQEPSPVLTGIIDGGWGHSRRCRLRTDPPPRGTHVTIPHTPAPATRLDGDSNHAVAAADGYDLAGRTNGYHRGSADDAVDVAALLVENRHLRARLETLPPIEQAKGILMARYEIDADAAFALLRRWSSHTNVKLRDISRLIVDATALPPDEAEPSSRPDGHRVDLEELILRLGTARSRRWVNPATARPS